MGATATPKTISSTDLDAFATGKGYNMEEFTELALYWMMEMFEEDADFAKEDSHESLAGFREKYGIFNPCMIEFGSSSIPKTDVHPFMHRLFSGDLKSIHGEAFGELNSKDVHMEHRFLATAMEHALAQNSWDECISELMLIESVVRHCPMLQNEAAAIHTLIEAEEVLSDFGNSVNAC